MAGTGQLTKEIVGTRNANSQKFRVTEIHKFAAYPPQNHFLRNFNHAAPGGGLRDRSLPSGKGEKGNGYVVSL